MSRYRFRNGVRCPRKFGFDTLRDSSLSVAVPGREFTIQDLAYRMQNGLPMPQMTVYRTYDISGIRSPVDIIDAFELSKQIDSNLDERKRLLADTQSDVNVSSSSIKSDVNVSSSEVDTQSSAKTNA